jgi:hypothetical protein
MCARLTTSSRRGSRKLLELQQQCVSLQSSIPLVVLQSARGLPLILERRILKPARDPSWRLVSWIVRSIAGSSS